MLALNYFEVSLGTDVNLYISSVKNKTFIKLMRKIETNKLQFLRIFCTHFEEK